MRKTILLAGASALVLGFGVAHANDGHHRSPSGDINTTNTTNTTQTTTNTSSNQNDPSSNASGSGVNASASNKASASSSYSYNSQSSSRTTTTSNSNNTANIAAAGAGGVAANNHSLAISASLSNFANKYKTISNYRLATATTSGTVYGGASASGGGSGSGMDERHGRRNSKGASGAPITTMSATLNNSANGTGIVTAQVNAGVNSLQQNTVALSSVVAGSTNTSVFH